MQSRWWVSVHVFLYMYTLLFKITAAPLDNVFVTAISQIVGVGYTLCLHYIVGLFVNARHKASRSRSECYCRCYFLDTPTIFRHSIG